MCNSSACVILSNNPFWGKGSELENTKEFVIEKLESNSVNRRTVQYCVTGKTGTVLQWNWEVQCKSRNWTVQCNSKIRMVDFYTGQQNSDSGTQLHNSDSEIPPRTKRQVCMKSLTRKRKL